jgi:hypothetical protein
MVWTNRHPPRLSRGMYFHLSPLVCKVEIVLGKRRIEFIFHELTSAVIAESVALVGLDLPLPRADICCISRTCSVGRSGSASCMASRKTAKRLCQPKKL